GGGGTGAGGVGGGGPAGVGVQVVAGHPVVGVLGEPALLLQQPLGGVGERDEAVVLVPVGRVAGVVRELQERQRTVLGGLVQPGGQAQRGAGDRVAVVRQVAVVREDAGADGEPVGLGRPHHVVDVVGGGGPV